MTYLFVITEFSVLRLFFAVLLGREILILDVEPLLPFTEGLLRRIATAIIGSGRAAWAIDSIDDLQRVKDVPGKSLLYDVLGKTESWQNDYFGFVLAEEKIDDDAMAYKLVVTNYLRKKHVSLLVLDRLFDVIPEQAFKCIGIPADTLLAAKSFSGKELSCTPAWVPARLINLGLAIAVGLASLWWIIRRTRLGKLTPKSFFFAADFIGDDRDLLLYRELENEGPMLMVPRGVGKTSPLASELKGYTFADLADGYLKAGDSLPAAKMVFNGIKRSYRHFNAFYPALFLRLAVLPYKRLLYRGLFSRFRPKFFWGRDLYNEDHIIRRQELNKAGGLSFGVNTGYLTWAILIPAWRYVSFDRFYVFGRGKYDRYYADTWADDMEIVPAGSFTAERRHYAKRFDARPPDIVVFASVFVGEPELTAFVRSLASTFSDRKILLQVKIKFSNTPKAQAFIDNCKEGLDNIEYSTASVYDLFFQARYGISDPSSVVVEAMQFGMISFAFDLPHLQKTNVNREYPGLILETAEDAIARIKAIEAGEWHYPIEGFQDVVDMSGAVFFDRVRQDMGLLPKQKNISLLGRQQKYSP